jgi:LDH2 family malate/lactate/ureidoglycolate dehydrogenase
MEWNVMAEAVYVPVKKLTEFMIEALTRMGVPRPDAEISADVLLASDLKGVRSHGIAHLHWYYKRIKSGLQQPVTNWKILNESLTTALIDGANGMGMVVGYNSMKIAIEKARKYGLGAVAVRNSSHYGVAGYYPLMAAKEGMFGMSVTNAHPSTAPTFGTRPMLGTNPIAVAAPTDEEFPYMFDAATSVAPRGKIEIAARASKPVPEGWVVNQEGVSVTDSANMIKEMDLGNVALLPVGGMGELMGGHKGYGLSTLVEILSP